MAWASACWCSRAPTSRSTNLSLHGFETGVWLDGVDGLSFRNNTLSNISLDGISGGSIHDAVFSGNSIDMKIANGPLHPDAIQFWNVAGDVPSSDILIENNLIRTHDFTTHGIYLNNESAQGGGGVSRYFHNFTIQGNTILSGDGLGLSVGQIDNLDIHDNIVLRDPALSGSNEKPIIRVRDGSTHVSVTDNVTHTAPGAAGDNWTAGEPLQRRLDHLRQSDHPGRRVARRSTGAPRPGHAATTTS